MNPTATDGVYLYLVTNLRAIRLVEDLRYHPDRTRSRRPTILFRLLHLGGLGSVSVARIRLHHYPSAMIFVPAATISGLEIDPSRRSDGNISPKGAVAPLP